jgi:hypothetical protein
MDTKDLQIVLKIADKAGLSLPIEGNIKERTAHQAEQSARLDRQEARLSAFRSGRDGNARRRDRALV